jgi:outer membrane protein
LSTWYNFKGASELSEKAELDFRQNEQELITRSVETYFDVLRAFDNLSSSIGEEVAFKQQLDQTRQRFDVGLVAITDVNESQAAFDLAKVARLSNQGILQTAYENLTLLTGKVYQSISLVSENLPITDPVPADRQSWVDMAAKGNLNLLAAEYATSAARYNYKQAASGHLPTLEAQFTQTEYNMISGDLLNDQGVIISDDEWEDSVGDLPERSDSAISLNLKIPIFSGGSVSASRRRAFSQFDSAQEQLSGTQRSVISSTRANHIAVQTQIQTVAARKQSITSAQSAVDAIEAGYQVGTRNIVDVLNAQRNLYNAQRDYANARYDYIEAMLELKLSAGLLSAGDIQTLNAFIMVDKPATEEAAIMAVTEANN